MIDLRVTPPNGHILNMVFKAQCMAALVKRTSRFNASVGIKLQLYLSHVRSLFQDCNPLCHRTR